MLKNNPVKRIGWSEVFAVAMLFIAALYILKVVVPVRVQDLFEAYHLLLIGALTGVYFSHRGLRGPVEIKLYIIFFVWVLLSRWLNRDIYLFIDKSLVVSALISILFFVTPFCLKKEERGVFLDALTVLYGGFFLFVSAAGLFVFITNTYIHIPPENVWITIKVEGELYSLNLLSTHRLASSARLFMAYALFVYQFFKRKNSLSRTISLVSIMIIHIAIGLCHSRTTQISASGTAAMLAMLLVIPKVKKHPFAIRSILTCAVAAIALVLCYLSFDVSNSLVTRAHSIAAPAFAEKYNSSDNKISDEYFGIRLSEKVSYNESYDLDARPVQLNSSTMKKIEAEREQVYIENLSVSASDNRKLAGNWTFTGRTEIWHAGFTAMIREPIKLLIGQTSKNLMQIINTILRELYPSVTEYKSHMHNSFVQTFMLLGIPGLIICLAWTCLLVKNMLKLFFSTESRYPLSHKIPVIALAGFLVINMFEPFLFVSLDCATIVFLLFAGFVLSESYDGANA